MAPNFQLSNPSRSRRFLRRCGPKLQILALLFLALSCQLAVWRADSVPDWGAAAAIHPSAGMLLSYYQRLAGRG